MFEDGFATLLAMAKLMLPGKLRSIFLPLLVVFFGLPCGQAAADRLRVVMPNGSIGEYADVTVQRLHRPGGGPAILDVVFPDRNVYPLELARCVAIEFGPGGEGRLADMQVRVDGAPRTFSNATLLSYANGQFTARPEGERSSYPVPAENVLSFQVAGMDAAEDDFFAATDEVEYGAPAPRSPDEDEYASDDEESYLDDDWDEGWDDDPSSVPLIQLLDEILYDTTDPTKLFWLRLMDSVGGVLWLITLVWLCAYAFTQGDIGWGIAMIVLCCCSPLKAFYVTRYEGGGRTVIISLVVLEILLWLAGNIYRTIIV